MLADRIVWMLLHGGILVLLTYTLACTSTSETSSEFEFKITEEAVAKIELKHVQGPLVVLTREGDRWRLNGGYYARDNAVKNLLDAMTRVELKVIPVESARTAMMQDIRMQGIAVTAYDQSGKEIIAYSVGGMTPDERGTYMLKKGSEMPAVVAIPGWEGGLRIRYWMAPIDWQDRTVFEVSSQDLVELSLEYFDQPAFSFHLGKTSSSTYQCQDFDRSDPPFGVLTAAVHRYLKEFQSVGAEAVINHADVEGFASETPPWCRLQLTTRGKLYDYLVYPLETAPTARGSIKRYHFINDKGDIFLVQDPLVHDIFVGYPYFKDHQHIN